MLESLISTEIDHVIVILGYGLNTQAQKVHLMIFSKFDNSQSFNYKSIKFGNLYKKIYTNKLSF